MILQPQENFSVVRQLQDPNDSGTYYVQAEIRNAVTDALIDTINLTDRGGQRFSLAWRTPADSSGLGFYISIRTRVYTDAEYTTLSDAYGQEINTYLVDNRFRILTGGGGGPDIDYKKIREIFVDVLKKFAFPEVDLSGVYGAIGKAIEMAGRTFNLVQDTKVQGEQTKRAVEKIPEALARIEAKEFPETDLSPVLAAIEAQPKFEKTDLSPLSAEFAAGIKTLEKAFGIFDSEEFNKAAKALPEVSQKIAEIQGNLKDFLYILAKNGAKTEQTPVIEKPDYQKQAKDLLSMIPPQKK